MTEAACLSTLFCPWVNSERIRRLPEGPVWWTRTCLYLSALNRPLIRTKSQTSCVEIQPPTCMELPLPRLPDQTFSSWLSVTQFYSPYIRNMFFSISPCLIQVVDHALSFMPTVSLSFLSEESIILQTFNRVTEPLLQRNIDLGSAAAASRLAPWAQSLRWTDRGINFTWMGTHSNPTRRLIHYKSSLPTVAGYS